LGKNAEMNEKRATVDIKQHNINGLLKDARRKAQSMARRTQQKTIQND
jgi:hypothetical protein